MDGSGIDFVLLPVIILPCLAAWLISIYYADAHPVWKRGGAGGQRVSELREAGPQEFDATAGQAAAVPAQRAAEAEILDDAASVR